MNIHPKRVRYSCNVEILTDKQNLHSKSSCQSYHPENPDRKRATLPELPNNAATSLPSQGDEPFNPFLLSRSQLFDLKTGIPARLTGSRLYSSAAVHLYLSNEKIFPKNCPLLYRRHPGFSVIIFFLAE